MSKIETFIKTINDVFNNPEYEGLTLNYYPHLTNQYNSGGQFKNETISDISKYYSEPPIEESYTEYVHKDKSMFVTKYINESENAVLNKDFQYNHQIDYRITDGLYLIMKIEKIDPNRFPILQKYYNTIETNVKSFNEKYINVSLITENQTLTYLKISITITNDDHIKKKIIKSVSSLKFL
jgi:hypothetical protein